MNTNRTRRLVAVFLCLLFCFGLCPLQVLAAVPTPNKVIVPAEDYDTAAPEGRPSAPSPTPSAEDSVIMPMANYIDGELEFRNGDGPAMTNVPAIKRIQSGVAIGPLPYVTSVNSNATFKGWCGSPNGLGRWYDDSTILHFSYSNLADKPIYYLYAIFEVPVINYVYFDVQAAGVTTPSALSIREGGSYGSLPTPSRTGYTLEGWYKEPACLNRASASETVYNSHTLYAKWTAGTYTVTYNTQKADVPAPSSKTVTFDAAYGTLATVSRTGYTFGGWYLEPACTNRVTATSIVSKTSHTLYAKWTARTFALSYDTQTADVPNPAGKTVTFGSPYGDLPVLSRTGYTFDGWFADATCTIPLKSDTPVATAAAHTAYAGWTAGRYTVSFDAHASDVADPDSITVTYLTPYGSLPAPSRTGYRFEGWFADAALNKPVTETTPMDRAEHHTLHAGWTAQTYNLSYDTRAADVPAPSGRTVTFDAPYGDLPVPARTGYTFRGWFADEGCILPVTETTAVKTAAHHTLYAGWSANTYPVSFDTHTPEVTAPVGRDVVFDSPYGILPILTRPGYAFDGWFSTAALVIPVDADTIVKTPAQHTLHAGWTALTYTITFDAQAEDVTDPDAQPGIYDAPYGALPTLTRTGYTFGGWHLDAACAKEAHADTIIRTAANHTLYAGWTANSYTVNFAVGTADVPAPESASVTYDAPYGVLPILTRTGYTFEGWFADTALASPVTESTIVRTASHHTLYAGWTANQYVLSFDTQTADVDSPASYEVTFASPYGSLPAPERTGYTFGGWYFDEEATRKAEETALVSTAAPHTLYALWTVNAYTVSFDTHAEDVYPPADIEVTYLTAYGSLPNPTRTGYAFAGWYKDAAHTIPVTADTVMNTPEDHTLRAAWTALEYELAYDAQAPDMPNPAGKRVIFDAPYGTLPELTRTGYTFSGWTLDAEGSRPVYADSPVKTAAAHTLYAQWTANTYTVSFDAGLGEAGNPVGKTVTYGRPYGALPEPTRAHYTFDGWYPSPESRNHVTVETIVTRAADHTLYAKWSDSRGSIQEEETNNELDDDLLQFLEERTPYVVGYDDGTFRAAAPLTRAEVSMMLFRLVVDEDKEQEEKCLYLDIDPAAWYAQAVSYLTSHGVLEGYEDGAFRPDKTISRAELAAIVSRAYRLPAAPADGALPGDIAAHWAGGYIAGAVSSGWMTGYGDGTFRPDQAVSRAETVVFFNRMLDWPQPEVLPEHLRTYRDLTPSHWAYNDILLATMETVQ